MSNYSIEATLSGLRPPSAPHVKLLAVFYSIRMWKAWLAALGAWAIGIALCMLA